MSLHCEIRHSDYIVFRQKKCWIKLLEHTASEFLKICEEFLYSDRYQYHVAAFSLVIVHDFLDHVDGIVAKAHRQMFGQIDDPLLGGFMDAFCDKVITL